MTPSAVTPPALAGPAVVPPPYGPPCARLDRLFDRVRYQGRPLLAGCLPAGWPPALAGNAAAWQALAAGVDLVEIALPSDDPYFDGDAMRAANQESLAAGYRHEDTLALISWLSVRVPVLVMTYWRAVDRYGPGRMARDLAAAGAAGAVLPDLPICRTAHWAWTASAAGLHTVLLASPDGAPRHPGGAGSGAVYLPATAGPTGSRSGPAPGLSRRVNRARTQTGLPVITGIGISAPRDAAVAARAGADCVLVGSAFTRAVASPGPGGDSGAAVSRLAGAFRESLVPCFAPGSADYRAA
ncbi:MAG TPA: tryptophan synthase subunit alpha [Trebonia sp.]